MFLCKYELVIYEGDLYEYVYIYMYFYFQRVIIQFVIDKNKINIIRFF